MKKIIIVGGVAGGGSAAARLRRLDENADIIMFERGEYISFANCGLPYYIGGEIKDKDALTLQTPESFNARFRVDVRTFSDVVGINREEKTVMVKDLTTGKSYSENYDVLILSPGAAPILPNIDGIKSDKVFTLRNIPDTYKIKDFIENCHPQNAIVVGGGYIGVEMAENLVKAGLDVTIVEMANQVIAPLDYDMACEIHRYMELNGVKLILENAVKGISEQDGKLMIQLNENEILSDMLIMAAGVRPESELAKAANLDVNERGAIIVNDKLQTSDPNIYAAGDAVEIIDFVSGQKGFIPLAGPANKQGRIIADNICGIQSKYEGTQGSAILKVFDMTVATTGINEKTAKRLGFNYDKSFIFPSSHASYYPGAINISIKTIYDKQTGKILGAQLTGFDGVDKRCDVFATAIRAGMTAYDLTKLELCYAPPYSSAKDPVNMSGFVIENALTGKVRYIHWHDVEKLPRDGSVTLIDVRTDMEYENGHIDGFNNLPLDDLRNNIAKIDKTKKVYITCQVGLRGYIASRILSQKGFDVYNLSGGYKLYKSIFEKPNVQQHVIAAKAPQNTKSDATIKIDASGLQCPGPIMKLYETIKTAHHGDILEITATDPACAGDVEAYCKRTGHIFLGSANNKGVSVTKLQKIEGGAIQQTEQAKNAKNIIVFSGDLDKAMAAFIIANTAAALGRKVSMFFTFWGLSILRRPEKVDVDKNLTATLFSSVLPKGSKHLGLSKMNMGGLGARMIRSIMKNNNVHSLEELITAAQINGVELVACSMSMDAMGLKAEELIDGVKLGGAAAMIAHAEESDMSLFI